MIVLPFDSTPDRTVTVDTQAGVYQFRTYYIPNEWLMDISDANGNLLLSAIVLNSGISNLLKGHSELFKGVEMFVAMCPGYSKCDGPESLGNSAEVIWLLSSEGNPNTAQDPLMV